MIALNSTSRRACDVVQIAVWTEEMPHLAPLPTQPDKKVAQQWRENGGEMMIWLQKDY